MTAVKITHHAMDLIKKYGRDDAVGSTSVAIVGPAKDFRIEHHRGQTPGDASTLSIILNRPTVFQAKLERNWEHDDALITETDDSMAQQKTWASKFLEIEK